VDPHLSTLIDLQQHDSRIAALEAEAARLPKQIAEIQAALAEAKKSVDSLRARMDQTRKDLRSKEKDLEVVAGKRSKSESRLYEVKTNKEYSAVLLEIEEIKQEKAQVEEQILGLMELQERVTKDIREAEQRHQTREEHAGREEAVIREKLARVEQELQAAQAERASRVRDLPPALLGDYDRIRRARGGVAVALVGSAGVCGGCRMAIRPQAMQELRAASSLMLCENCGRFLGWQE
jgi:predicted  nucleic acid-binding Zn-ribbon protein